MNLNLKNQIGEGSLYSLTAKNLKIFFCVKKSSGKNVHTIEIYSHRSGKRERTIFFIERMLSAS